MSHCAMSRSARLHKKWTWFVVKGRKDERKKKIMSSKSNDCLINTHVCNNSIQQVGAYESGKHPIKMPLSKPDFWYFMVFRYAIMIDRFGSVGTVFNAIWLPSHFVLHTHSVNVNGIVLYTYSRLNFCHSSFKWNNESNSPSLFQNNIHFWYLHRERKTVWLIIICTLS